MQLNPTLLLVPRIFINIKYFNQTTKHRLAQNLNRNQNHIQINEQPIPYKHERELGLANLLITLNDKILFGLMF